MEPRIILDSGAYTAHKQGSKIDIDAYAAFCKENKDFFSAAFNLDVIMNAKASYDNWKYLREKGVNTLPVYHIGTDEMWLKKYLKQTNHIGLGAVANLSSVQRIHGLDHIWQKHLLDAKGKPLVKVHGLGITAPELMIRYPWHSVDSFTPVLSASFGATYLPKILPGGDLDYVNGFLCKISNQGKQLIGNKTHFLGFGKGIQNKYEALFNAHGFSLGDLANQEQKQTRKDKKMKKVAKPPALFEMPLNKESLDPRKTIAGNWEERLRWTLVMWNELRKQMDNKTIIYLGISTDTIAQVMAATRPKHDALVSYAYLTDRLFTSLKKFKTCK